YPGFLSRLSKLIEVLFHKEIEFEQPALLLTKGQVLEDLAKLEQPSSWVHKWSCSHDQRHASRDGKRIHCGVCGGCILRRVSMLAANIQDPTDYLFSSLNANEIEKALSSESKVHSIKAMKDVAGNTMRDMQRLADYAQSTVDTRLQCVALD